MRQRLGSLSHDTFRSFRHRNFRLFFGGQTISQVGNWLTMVGLVLLILKRTDNGLAVGLLTAAQFAPVLLIGAFTGLLADRSDKRRLLMITQTIAMFQSFGLAFLAFQPDAPILSFYALALIGGFVTAFDNPSRRAFVVEMVPEVDVANAVSLNSALMTGSRVIGPALAGLLTITVGYGWTFAIDGLSYLAVLAGLYAMRTEELRKPVAVPRGKGQVREGLRYVRTQPVLWIPLVMMAIVGTFAFNFQTVLPLFVTRTLHGSDTNFTVLFSVVSLGSLVGALATARRRTIGVRQVVVASAGFGVSMFVLGAMPNLAATFPAALFMGFTSIAFMTSSTAIVQMQAAPAMRGRVLALQSMVFLGSTPIGGPLLGAVCDAHGARVGLYVGGVAALAAAALGAGIVRRRSGAADRAASRGPTEAPMAASVA
jgi:MFS family permease